VSEAALIHRFTKGCELPICLNSGCSDSVCY
jgi:hypothetical protein